MLRIGLWVILGIVVLVVVVLLVAMTKPDTFRIERTVTINAPADKIYGLIDDLHNWPRWAPQDREDPGIQRSFSGSRAGVGAACEWKGSKGSTGAGEMKITEDAPLAKVVVAADWRKPFQVRNVNEFTLTAASGGQAPRTATQVTWTLSGPNLFVMKLMEVFMGVGGMMGPHLDAGLKNLKAVAEQ